MLYVHNLAFRYTAGISFVPVPDKICRELEIMSRDKQMHVSPFYASELAEKV